MIPGNYKTFKSVIDFLIVDDLEVMRRSVRDMLLRAYGDVKVEVAKSGKEALNMIKTNEVRFVISDWNMPHMTGIELLQVTRKDPEHCEIPFLMISDEMGKDKFTLAVEECVDGYKIKPFTEDELMAAIEEIRKNRENLTPVESKINMLRRLQLLRQYDKAINMGKEMLKEEKKNPDVTFLVGESYYFKQDYKNARKYLKKLIDDQSNGKAMHLYGKICMAMGEYEEAIDYLEKSSTQNPLNMERRIDFGTVYLELGMEEEADDVFDGIMRSSPTDLNLIKMGEVFVKKQELKKAGKFLKQAVDPIPDSISVFNRYAIELRRQGEYEESLEQYKKCLEVLPDQPTVLFNMGMVYFEMGDNSKAKQKLNLVLKIKPDFEKAQRLLEHINKKTKGKVKPA